MKTIEQAVGLVEEITRRKLEEAAYFSIGEARRELGIRELIYYIKGDLRMYVIASDTQVADIWDYIRSDEHRLDFILETHAELMLRLENPDSLYGEIAAAYGIHVKQGVMDADTHDRLPDSKTIQELLSHNQWLVLFYVLALTRLAMGE